MAKEIYIDENGNEIPINSAPTYASQMPLSPTDDTNTASAIGDLSDLNTTEKSSLVRAVNEVDASKMTMLRLKSISITGATGVAWIPHYYTDIDISSYFTGADANAVIIGVIINQQTSGGVLCAMLQGARTIRLLNDQAFTNVTCNITCLYYRP